jgi:hypothetical protein
MMNKQIKTQRKTDTENLRIESSPVPTRGLPHLSYCHIPARYLIQSDQHPTADCPLTVRAHTFRSL